jgi:hypothetical protein
MASFLMASFLRAGTQSSRVDASRCTCASSRRRCRRPPSTPSYYLAHKLLKPAKEHRLRASLYLRTFALFEAESALWLDPNKDTVEKLMENDDDDPLESASASLTKAQWERYV